MSHAHRIGGIVALALVLLFWTATVVSLAVGNHAAVATVKTAIAWGLLLLVPAVMTANATGFKLARLRRPAGRALPPLLARKQQRGIIVAALGLTVLAPCALWLAASVSSRAHSPAYWTVQFIELTAGAVNVTLLALNARDGLRMRPARRIAAATASPTPRQRLA
jgi:hypothetical protein